MDEKDLVDLISDALGEGGGRGRGEGGRKPDRGGDKGGRGGGPEGFQVDTAALDAYAKQTAKLAEELRESAKKGLGGITGEGFGRIGRDSGFAEALAGFAKALGTQVSGVAGNAAELGRATRRTADAYQEQDGGIAIDLSKLLG
ncbi:type VII secretion target [Actinokineospora bangkokensis]|uniref:ESX-1 secretion-associated protein n=1 Tax=Actinokineospora bangkokensis TaxID=1193682 RepID=A0A1Q9LSY6_9PSEU|nr:type VII secretion target [Actinokineospora bangkokensis]OLR95152.1 hypothetical protein BJP25_07580 [Actinokineospora bangkokensis]